MADNDAGNSKADESTLQSTSNEGTDNASDAKKTKSAPQAFDVSQLGDEDFSKVFDDPRLWEHSRFKKLNERAKKAREYEAEQKQAEEKRLKEQGKLTELNERLTKERDDAIGKVNETQIAMAIQNEANKQGAVDVGDILKLVDRTNIAINDDGNVTGALEAVTALKESKAHLFGESQVTRVGSGTNPPTDANKTVRRFKHSQIQDPQFFQENETEILEALKLGLVEDDLNR